MAKLIDIANIMKLFAREQTRPRSACFRHCAETKMDVFIDCMVDHKFNRLVKYGNPSQHEIVKAWEDLFSEYCELTNTPGYKQILRLTKEIGALNSKIMSVNLCIQVLAYRYSETCVNTLHRFGYKARFDIADKDKYLNDLRSIQTKIKAAALALEQRTAEYKKVISETNGKTPSHQYFADMMMELSKYMGFRMKADEISITEYVSIMQKREKEMELNNRYAQKYKQHGPKR